MFDCGRALLNNKRRAGLVLQHMPVVVEVVIGGDQPGNNYVLFVLPPTLEALNTNKVRI